ncbi:MAG TPA: GNAT family N-acetyltransferase, partial [Chthonomonadaceae bacterium]|nr:GNAT family N-acetyltransferase [Chthonomonadaceae bacterium]
VGGQDIGGAVELRRMYVRQDFRRRGIGRDLVKALVAHCGAQGVPVIELWTAREGAGRKLYESIGFQMVANPGEAFANVEAVTGYTPGEDEIRMRLQLD